jgi:hypothetical protein
MTSIYLARVDPTNAQDGEFDQPGLARKLQTEHESDFTNKMGAEHMGFITDRVEGGIVPRNTEFMATRCFKSNCRFSITHPRM